MSPDRNYNERQIKHSLISDNSVAYSIIVQEDHLQESSGGTEGRPRLVVFLTNAHHASPAHFSLRKQNLQLCFAVSLLFGLPPRSVTLWAVAAPDLLQLQRQLQVWAPVLLERTQVSCSMQN